MACLKPFRPVGSVCGDYPGSFSHFNGVPFFVVPLGFTYAVYKGIELRAIRGGATFENRVVSVATSGKYRIVAEGANVHCYAHHKLLWSHLHAPVLKSNVVKVLVKDNIVFSLGEDRVVTTWSLRRGHRIFAFLVGSSSGGAITSWCVPVGYRNKLLVGTSEGDIILYNYSRPASITNEEAAQGIPSDIAPLFRKRASGSADGLIAVSALETTLIKDIVAFATSTGKVALYDFAHDEIISEFRHSATMNPRISSASQQQFLTAGGGSFVTALAFRPETADSHPMLVSAAADGSVAVWDLEKRTLHGMLSATKQRSTEQALTTPAHHAAVHTLCFCGQNQYAQASSRSITGDPAATKSAHPPDALLISAGSDNALIQWSFHTVDGAAMRVRFRSGHRSPCTCAAFYGPDLIVSAAGDEDGSLRVTHLFSDRASWELSQGSGVERQAASTRKTRSELLLAPCREIVCAPIRNHQWSSVITRHESSAKVAGWAFDSRKLKFLCEPIRTVTQSVTSMAVSLCGSYIIVGFSSGHIVRVTIQDETMLHFVHIHNYNQRSASSSSSSLANAHGLFADSGQDTDVVLPGARTDDPRAIPPAHCGSVGSTVVTFDNDVVITTGPANYLLATPSTTKRCTGPVWMYWSLLDGKLLGWSRAVESPIHLLREIGHLSEGTKSASSTLLCAASADHSLRVYSLPHPDASWFSAIPLESRAPRGDDDDDSDDDAPGKKQTLKATDVALSDRSIKERVHVSRCFVGHRAPITDIAVSPDTRKHVFSSSADGGLAVWDVAADTCIGIFKAHAPITSLAFDPDGAFLLTAHAGDRCPQLWSCLLRYGMVCKPIDAKKPEAWEQNAMQLVGLLHKEEHDNDAASDHDDDNEQDDEDQKKKGPAQLFSADEDIALRARRLETERREALMSIPCEGWSLSAHLRRRRRNQQGSEKVLKSDAAAATASAGGDVGNSTGGDTAILGVDDWLTMPKLDAIYQKNEPLLPPKKVDAPFFLPMTQELKPTFIVQEQKQENATDNARAAAQRRSQKAKSGGPDIASRRGLGLALDEFLLESQQQQSATVDSSSSSSSSFELRATREKAAVDKLLNELINAPGGVAALDAEILLLTNPVADDDTDGKIENIQSVLKLLKFCAAAIRLGEAVDFVQALLATTLKHHGHLIVDDELETQVQQQREEEEEEQQNGASSTANAEEQEERRRIKDLVVATMDEVRSVLSLLRTAQKQARTKMDSMCGATVCFASTFANAYG